MHARHGCVCVMVVGWVDVAWVRACVRACVNGFVLATGL